MYEDPGPGIETKQNKTKIVDAARCNQYLFSLNPSKATCRILYLLGAIKNTRKCQLHSAPTRRAQWDSLKEESREGPNREHSAPSPASTCFELCAMKWHVIHRLWGLNQLWTKLFESKKKYTPPNNPFVPVWNIDRIFFMCLYPKQHSAASSYTSYKVV